MYQSTDHLVANEQGVPSNGYQSIEEGGDAKGVPPAPQTLLSAVRRAKEESPGCCSFCLAFFALILGSIIWTIAVIIVITVPIVMIVIGAEYFNACPAQHMIPISAIVAGCVGLLSNALNIADRWRRFAEKGIPTAHSVIGWINFALNIFLVAWFVAMCYWVYSADVQFSNSGLSNFCDQRLYGFVFWLVNFVFIFLGAAFVFSLIFLLFAVVCW